MDLILLSAFVSLTASLLLTPIVIRFAEAKGWVDRPDDGRRAHLMAVPRLGGVAVMAALTAGLAVAYALTPWLPQLDDARQQETMRLVFAGGGFVFLIGLYDDLWGLAPRAKLLLTAIVGAGLWFAGFRIESLAFPYSRAISVEWISFPLTVIWVTGMTHALNLIDGLDGLASGIAVIAVVTAGISAVFLDQAAVVIVATVFAASMIGFLKYNRHPARIFLGDCGSLPLGTMLAVLTVRGAQDSSSSVLILSPLLALAYPLLDTGLSMMRRWLRGVSFSIGDRRHIHHQLLAVSGSYKASIGTLYLCAAGLAALGLLVSFAPRSLVAMIALVGGSLSLVLIIAGVRWLGYHELLEAAASLLSVLRNGRRIVQDKIFARDVCDLLEKARTLPDVERILGESAREFGFMHIELYREPAMPTLEGATLSPEQRSVAWRLEYPINPWGGADATDTFGLRIWCHISAGSRPYGAERAARLLAPTLEQRLRSLASPSIEESHVPERSAGRDRPFEKVPITRKWRDIPAAHGLLNPARDRTAAVAEQAD